MDALILSRIQFGISIGFHYIYPVTTFGLTLFILIFETSYLLKNDLIDRKISSFLINILGITFSFGVATGLMMPFVIGSNWARFSVFSGGIFGTQLAIESTTAFALESVFLAILVFGREKAGKKLFWFSALMVFTGSHLSGFWIVSANSWMQSPAGYGLDNGRLILTSLYDAVFNPTAVVRFIHVTSAAWLTGSILVSGISAYYLLRKHNIDFAKKMMSSALVPFISCSILQAAIGHTHIMQVKKYEPAKNAAYEGMFKETTSAPLYVFGIPDAENRSIHFGIKIPYALSFLETGSIDGKVEGLDGFPESEWPPVNTIFITFHLMVMIGSTLIAIGLLSGFFFLRKNLFEKAWLLRLLVLIIPLPYITNEIGWIGTEMGRQPWIITGLMKTSTGSTTTIPAEQMLFSLALIFAVNIIFLAVYVFTVIRIVNSGPDKKGLEE